MSDNYADWLTRAQVAEILNVSERTVTTLTSGPTARIETYLHQRPGKSPVNLYKPEDVEAERQRRNPKKAMVVHHQEDLEAPSTSFPGAGYEAPQAPAGLREILLEMAHVMRPRRGPQFFNTEQAARMLGIPKSQVEKARKSGKLPGKFLSRRWYFRREDLEMFEPEWDTPPKKPASTDQEEVQEASRKPPVH